MEENHILWWCNYCAIKHNG